LGYSQLIDAAVKSLVAFWRRPSTFYRRVQRQTASWFGLKTPVDS